MVGTGESRALEVLVSGIDMHLMEARRLAYNIGDLPEGTARSGSADRLRESIEAAESDLRGVVA
ncbi:MAG: hypothetical protein MPK62_00535 [Alphaproteobacteria bacterium]|nr:hypothetical protein [Alphaproteobacteria bacterium]MDA8029625.1 hypothetical protein [Alphaproteobacteria bacterium]